MTVAKWPSHPSHQRATGTKSTIELPSAVVEATSDAFRPARTARIVQRQHDMSTDPTKCIHERLCGLHQSR